MGKQSPPGSGGQGRGSGLEAGSRTGQEGAAARAGAPTPRRAWSSEHVVPAGNRGGGERSLILLRGAGISDPDRGGWGLDCGAAGRAGCQGGLNKARAEKGNGTTEGGWEAVSFPSARFLSLQSVREVNRETATLRLHIRGGTGKGCRTRSTGQFTDARGGTGAQEESGRRGVSFTSEAPAPQG